jgi:hypothetical protein
MLAIVAGGATAALLLPAVPAAAAGPDGQPSAGSQAGSLAPGAADAADGVPANEALEHVLELRNYLVARQTIDYGSRLQSQYLETIRALGVPDGEAAVMMWPPPGGFGVPFSYAAPRDYGAQIAAEFYGQNTGPLNKAASDLKSGRIAGLVRRDALLRLDDEIRQLQAAEPEIDRLVARAMAIAAREAALRARTIDADRARRLLDSLFIVTLADPEPDPITRLYQAETARLPPQEEFTARTAATAALDREMQALLAEWKAMKPRFRFVTPLGDETVPPPAPAPAPPLPPDAVVD